MEIIRKRNFEIFDTLDTFLFSDQHSITIGLLGSEIDEFKKLYKLKFTKVYNWYYLVSKPKPGEQLCA